MRPRNAGPSNAMSAKSRWLSTDTSPAARRSLMSPPKRAAADVAAQILQIEEAWASQKHGARIFCRGAARKSRRGKRAIPDGQRDAGVGKIEGGRSKSEA